MSFHSGDSSEDLHSITTAQFDGGEKRSNNVTYNEKAVISTTESLEQWVPPQDYLTRFKDEYTGRHNGETLPPGTDIDRVAEAVFTLNVEQSVEMLKATVDAHEGDYTFDTVFMARIRLLIEGKKALEVQSEVEVATDDWEYEVCRTAGVIHNWSPYAEVRSVTVPYDDPEEACETFRAWFLGMFWVVICTAVNTCPCPISNQYY